MCVCLSRGFVYCRNEELEPGWVVFSSGRLLHRPASFDAKAHQLCQVIDPFTLQVSLRPGKGFVHDSVTLWIPVPHHVHCILTLTLTSKTVFSALVRCARSCPCQPTTSRWEAT